VLPSDRYIASLLGFDEEQYEYWKDYVAAQAKKGPQPSVVCGDPATTLAIVSLVITVIGVGFQIVGALLSRQDDTAPAELRARQRTGSSQLSITSFAPRAGFDATQDVAGIGAPIPVVYANRETLGGQAYGGVRVNLSLLWSQILSLGGSQMLRGIFMIGEGNVSSIDPNGFAVGDNSLASYDLLSTSANEAASRLTIYHRPNGGRIVSANRIAGRLAAGDIGNAQNDGGSDVFQLRSVGNTYASDFSASIKPSTSTTFGVYTLIGNNLGFKLSPRVRPQSVARLKPKGDNGNSTVVCDTDLTVKAEREKFSAYYSSRSGVTAGTFNLGDTFTYTLDRSSDYETVFLASDGSSDSWTSSSEVRSRPDFYDTSDSKISGLAFGSRMTVGSVASAVDGLEVDATLDVEGIVDHLEANSAANGEYVVRYWINISNGKTDLRSKFDVTIRVQSNKGVGVENVTDESSVPVVIGVRSTPTTTSKSYRFVVEVDDDSGLIQVLSSPLRLRSRIFFGYTKKDTASLECGDVASSVTGRQRAWDDAIVVGDLYKFGSALAICTSRNPDDKVFVSDSEEGANGTGQSISANFRVVRAGSANTIAIEELRKDGDLSATRQTATSWPHLTKIAIASFSTTSECRLVEIGIRSTLGIRINGICNFRDTLTLQQTDNFACESREGDTVKRGDTIKVDQYQSDRISTAEERYSFFRISYRESGSTAAFTQLDNCFGTRGMTQQASFSYIRLQMPSRKRWEFRIEPLSGWEIRSGQASGKLAVLDAKLSSSLAGSSGGVTWYSNGPRIDPSITDESVSRARSTFTITATRRNTTMGFPRPDENNYLDAWGKLAEEFVYEEVESSAAQGPEHEVVYVNEISQNSPAPNYDGIALVGLNIRSAFEWSQFRQLSAYLTGGVVVRRLLNSLSEGPSHLFPDIALDRFTNAKYGPGRISDDLIDLDSFQLSAQWCLDKRYFFDGAVMLGTNAPRQWAADIASTMLLDFKEVNGRYSLAPALTFSTVKHKALFTAGDIEEGSFKFETISVDDLRPIRVSAKWREERSSSSLTSPGFFPVEREVLVREIPFSTSSDPIESVDLSDYATNENHAIDVCKFRIRARRLRDHSIRFTVTYASVEGVCKNLSPGDYIKFALDSTIYSEFNNGIVLTNGTVVSTVDLAPGSYSVLGWDGGTSSPSMQTLTINPAGIGSPAGIIFTVAQSQTQVRTYQITKITPTEEGKFDIEAIHAPVNASGILLMAENWDDNVNTWEISR
jgi:hypothetical protein